MEKKYQLPKEFADKWVKALRSGEYRQTTGKYRKNNCYCALGVGLLVNGCVFINDNHVAGREDDIYFGNGFFSEVFMLNDYKKLSFPEIADWIEASTEFI